MCMYWGGEGEPNQTSILIKTILEKQIIRVTWAMVLLRRLLQKSRGRISVCVIRGRRNVNGRKVHMEQVERSEVLGK